MKWIKELEEDTSALKGQPLYMTCELNKERDVVWRRNGEVLKKKAGKVQINIIGLQHAVTIQNATEDDTGTYSCEVVGQEDVKTATNAKVIGKHKTSITSSSYSPEGTISPPGLFHRTIQKCSVRVCLFTDG